MRNESIDYDVIIVGAGAGGGVAAGVLAEAGRSVLVLERGAAMRPGEIPLDHLRNHRLSQYGVNTQCDLDGIPRVAVDAFGNGRTVSPLDGAYHLNAFVVGGGTLVYGAQAWRFLPDDFRMASKYGSPEGSSLADWPISYDDLEPWYDKVEWEVGVCGAPHKLSSPRSRAYPMPPVPDTLSRKLLQAAAGKLGWETGPVPLLINSVTYNGRPACEQCGMCVGFGCPNDSKNGSQNTMLARALKTGRCTLVTGATADRLLTDARGRVTGVSYFVDTCDTPTRIAAQAKVVIVAASAVETARLLLNSPTDREPNGIGNNADHVGRHLNGHSYPGANGLFDDIVHDGIGPGVSISTLQFNHDNPGLIGGGMLANEFVKLPIIFQKGSFPPGMSRWGIEAKRYMRSAFTRSLHVQGPVQDIPSPSARVTIDRDVRDRYGIPVVRIGGANHPETARVCNSMRDRAIEWLTAAGAKKVWGWAPTGGLTGGQHQSGTCRMGNDPKSSVTDAWGRVHSQESLYIADGGLHVTNGGLNPVLTIMALAWRVADRVSQVI